MINNGPCTFCSSAQQKHLVINCEKYLSWVESVDYSKLNLEFIFVPLPKYAYFVEALKIMYKIFRYILKAFRIEVVKSFTCNKSGCSSTLCILKQIFYNMSISYIKTGQYVDLRSLLQVIESNYFDSVIVESVLDALIVLVHSFSIKTDNCSNNYNHNLFKPSIIEHYKCECSSKFFILLKSDIFYFTIEVNNIDSLTYRLFNLKKIQDSQKQYKICNIQSCSLKKSIKSDFLKISPYYLIFKVIWNIAPFEIKSNSMSIELNTKDLFLCDSNEIYFLSLIVLRDKDKSWVFYYLNKCWYGNEAGEAWDFYKLIDHINEKALVLEMMVYEKNMTIKNKDEPEKSPMMDIRENIERKGDDESLETMKEVVWECENCNTGNHNIYDICTKCESIRPGKSGWVCQICKFLNPNDEDQCQVCDPYIPNLYLKSTAIKNFTEHSCPKCKNQVINGQHCKICSENSIKEENKRNQLFKPTISSSVKHKKCNKCKQISDSCSCILNKFSSSEKARNLRSSLKTESPSKEPSSSKAGSSLKTSPFLVSGSNFYMSSLEKNEIKGQNNASKTVNSGNNLPQKQLINSPYRKPAINNPYKRN